MTASAVMTRITGPAARSALGFTPPAYAGDGAWTAGGGCRCGGIPLLEVGRYLTADFSFEPAVTLTRLPAGIWISAPV